MSEAAVRERAGRQRWAVPGSLHDRLVTLSKIALPSAVGVLIAFLAVAPLKDKGDVSFILDKNKVENAPERMRVESARYLGSDNRGQKFEITAGRAIQRSSDVPIVDLRSMFARLALEQGPLMIAADRGRYNLDMQRIVIDGPMQVVGPDNYRLATSDVSVDLKNREVRSDGPVSGQTRLGPFEAGRLRADLGSRTVVLDGGARLKIVQGTVR